MTEEEMVGWHHQIDMGLGKWTWAWVNGHRMDMGLGKWTWVWVNSGSW